ncbi:hypothetical protein TRFO_08379 [Tritrichomonas foetus]|uniref:Uncharacterized protein n=1 Tax=Tritrichomonas foetus TaxID=1144522 RepID=A0A1J4JLA1_9EUKA|nr:hypothetical protein TRFO_08379 [Tritrichomonas foetus]|eukprot:OHS99449.1 hypothetical protein TRFO_08379 [Tritrichomonas foetus]
MNTSSPSSPKASRTSSQRVSTSLQSRTTRSSLHGQNDTSHPFTSRTCLANRDNHSSLSSSLSSSLGNRSHDHFYVKKETTNFYVPPSILKIPKCVNKVLSNVSNLFVSNDVILELSVHLKNIKNLIARAEVEEIALTSLQSKCVEEWNLFGQQMVEIVAIDENPNIRQFCTRQFESLSMILSALHSNEDKINKNQTAKNQLQKIDEKIEESKKNLTENLPLLPASLKALQRVALNSATVFNLGTTNQTESNLFMNNFKQGVNGMIQYIQNANEAVEARKYLQVFAYDAMKEIQELFSAAQKEEKKMNEIKSIETSTSPSHQSESPQKKKVTKQLKSYPVPKHTPVSRPKLYEERRRVSAMGPLRAKVSSQGK